MKTKELGDVVMLVKVFPYGKAEKTFMKDFHEKIEKELNIKDISVQLYELFGWKSPTGVPYNQYVLDFDQEKDFEKADNYLRDYFYNMVVEDQEAYDDPMHPEIIWARRR